MNGKNIEDTVRDLWATRPHRPEQERKVAGVAAAIGHRYATDPVLVRVAFVVATLFGGAGILLYLLGWLLLPGEGDETSAAESLLGRGRSSVSPGLTVLLGLALILAIGVVFDDLSGVVGLALAVGGIFLLHRSRAALGPAPAATPAPTGTGTGTITPVTTGPETAAAPESAPPSEAGRTSESDQKSESAQTSESGQTSESAPASGSAGERRTPPAWDPLSAAPFAWDLPEPAPVPPQVPRAPRSKVTPITLGVVLLVGGLSSASWPAMSIPYIAALLLGVVGTGLVVGSLVRGGRGLIPIAVPLAVLVWVLHAVPVSEFRVGEGVWTPATPAQVQPSYAVTMGTGRLDLTRLQIPAGQTVRTAVGVGLGEVQVTLPRTLDTLLDCRVPIGAADCLGVTSSGIPARVDKRDPGTGGPGGGTLILDVRSAVGNVHVTRAP